MNNRTIIILSAAVTALLCLIDYSSRLTLTEVQNKDKNIILKRVALQTAFLTNAEKQNLTKRLSMFDVVAPKNTAPLIVKKVVTKKPVKLWSQAKQQSQQGKLDNLIDDKFQYRLIATFDNKGHKFALLEKKNLLTQSKQKIRLFVGEQLSAYHLTQVASNWIELTQGMRNIQLQLFLIKNH